jgi:EAL domain-containing protein (putative c-di-GMP-specific phosphodiesterase class I)
VDIAFQPVWNIKTHRIYGYESLLRPQNLLSPLEVLEDARACGQLPERELDWMRSAAEIARWRLAPHERLMLNVETETLSAYERFSPWPLPFEPERTVLEITERCVPNQQAIAVLRDMGVLIALDDFGSERVDLQVLERVQPDLLKMDRRFVIHHARTGVLAGMAQFVRTTGALLVAEGIETWEDLQFVRSIGVDYAQGYLLGRPMLAQQTSAKKASLV